MDPEERIVLTALQPLHQSEVLMECYHTCRSSADHVKDQPTVQYIDKHPGSMEIGNKSSRKAHHIYSIQDIDERSPCEIE